VGSAGRRGNALSSVGHLAELLLLVVGELHRGGHFGGFSRGRHLGAGQTVGSDRGHYDMELRTSIADGKDRPRQVPGWVCGGHSPPAANRVCKKPLRGLKAVKREDCL